MRVAFCGLGQMGAPMARRLVAAGHEVTVWNRTPERAAPFGAEGTLVAATPAEAARGADVAMTILGGPGSVADVLLGAGGLVEGLQPGAVVFEMSTIGPVALRELADRVAPTIDLIDAPVLGSVPHAEQGTLQIFVGATEPDMDRWRDLLAVLGTPRYLGRKGDGATLKLAVNSTIGALVVCVAEALALTDAAGLEPGMVLDILSDSPVGFVVKGRRRGIEEGTYPPNFKLWLSHKDLRLAVETAAGHGLDLPLARASRDWLAAAEAAGLGDLDHGAVIAFARKRPASL
jgi:3-hydroxyisobutyrate dehydrogenase